MRGVAYVFSNGPTGWHQTGELIGPNLTAADNLGSRPYTAPPWPISGSTAGSGATAIARAPAATSKLTGKPSRAFVFTRTASGSRQEANLPNRAPTSAGQ